jgi:hypothetical protein
MNVRIFGGHRDTQVNNIASSSNPSQKFISDFATCDAKGFVATWDLRSPKRMANASLPFLTMLLERNKNKNKNKSKNNNNDGEDDDESVEITEILNTGEFSTVALSETDIAMIDWRKPRVPVWTYSQQQNSSAFCFLLSTQNNEEENSTTTRKELAIFHEEGQVTILDEATGTFRRSAPESLSQRQEMQLPCGVQSYDSSLSSLSSSRFAIIASTFGKVSLLDLKTWSILGSAVLGGLKDEQQQQDEESEQQKSSIEKITNPPFLASLSCIESPFLIGGKQQIQGNEDDEDDDEGKISKNKNSSSPSIPTATTALVSRADGVVAFAHLQANTHPAAVRCSDITTTDFSHSLCSADWIRQAGNFSLISCVGLNGVVSFWQVPSSAYKFIEDEDEQQQEEEEEAELKQVGSVNLMDAKKYCANDSQKKVVGDGEAQMNCSKIVTSGDKTGLVVGDTAGRVMWIDVDL